MRTPEWPVIVRWMATVASIPFFLGALMMAVKLFRLPDTAGNFARAQLFEAILFSFGFALGLCASGVAVATRSRQRRMLATAAVTFGCANIAFAYAATDFVEKCAVNGAPDMLPLALPVSLWLYSVLLAVRVPSLSEKSPEEPTVGEAASEQPQQPLSRP